MYRYPRLLYLTAWLFRWGFRALLLTMVGVLVVFLFHSVALAIFAFCLFLPAGLFVTIVRLFLRCPSCGSVILVGRLPEHAEARRLYGTRGLIGVIDDILKNRRFTCLECGSRCALVMQKA